MDRPSPLRTSCHPIRLAATARWPNGTLNTCCLTWWPPARRARTAQRSRPDCCCCSITFISGGTAHCSARNSLTSARPDKNGVVGRAKEIATKEEADALRGLKLFVPRDRLPEPEEDEFYLTDLIGLEARDPSGATLGRVKAIQNFGASDMLEIAPAAGGPTWYLAFTRENVPAVHVAEGWLLALRPDEVGEPEPH